jgi:hypothetical protein
MGKRFEMTDEEKVKIREQHKEATKAVNDRKDELKKGLQKQEKPKEEKPNEKKNP